MLINQIALSGRQPLSMTTTWYIDGLGFLFAGSASFGGPEIASAQGIEVDDVQLNLSWVVDRNHFMQLELFEYSEPATRPRRPDWSMSDTGYNLLMLHVDDLDHTLARLSQLGTIPLTAPVGANGSRRVCVTDPNGTLIELCEQDTPTGDRESVAHPNVPVAIRAVRAAVVDLAKAKQFFADTIGMQVSPHAIHEAQHEALWGLSGMQPEVVTLTDGRSFLELASYPQTRDWPIGYRISDEGILNIALGSEDPGPFRSTLDRVSPDVHQIHEHLAVMEGLEVNYVTSDQGFSVELMSMGPGPQRQMGFSPVATPKSEWVRS